jgi:ribosome-associated toxin RatA of RatAB toxin-antitoxin module
MPQITAHDEIEITASTADVWKILIDIPNYPEWWPKLVNLKILMYNPEIIGSEFQANPLGGKSFACRVISIESQKEIKLNYYDGIYSGIGVWNLKSKDGIVKVSYSIDLEIVDKSIALLSRIISIPKLHSMIFKRILNGLSDQVNFVK